MKLGLVGEPAAGKDAVANWLVLYKDFTKFAFADKIKEEYYALTGYNEKIFKEKRGLAKEKEIREGLWKYSDKKIAENGKLYFVKPVIDAVNAYKNAVITDIRTIEELGQIKENKIKVIYIYKETPIYKPNDIVSGSRIKYKDLCRAHFISLRNDYPNLEALYMFMEEFYERFIGA